MRHDRLVRAGLEWSYPLTNQFFLKIQLLTECFKEPFKVIRTQKHWKQWSNTHHTFLDVAEEAIISELHFSWFGADVHGCGLQSTLDPQMSQHRAVHNHVLQHHFEKQQQKKPGYTQDTVFVDNNNWYSCQTSCLLTHTGGIYLYQLSSVSFQTV